MIDVIAEFEEKKDNLDEYNEIRTEDMFLSTWTIYLAGKLFSVYNLIAFSFIKGDTKWARKQ